MKKLSLLIAMLIVFSSLFAVPAFAANQYTYIGSTNSHGGMNTATSGITLTNKTETAPQNSGAAYRLNGTSLVNNATYTTYYTGKAWTYGSTDTDFDNKTTYSWEFDVFFPSKLDTPVSEEEGVKITNAPREIVIYAGYNQASVAFAFRAGDEYNSATDLTHGKTYTKIFYGLKLDTWHRITINTTLDTSKTSSNATYNVYLDGKPFEYYCETKNTTSIAKVNKASTGIVASFNTTDKTWTMRSSLSFWYVQNTYYDVYFDNLILSNSIVTPSAALTIEDASAEGVVTLYAGSDGVVSLAEVESLKADNTTIEVYRKPSDGVFTQITEGNVANGDIIKYESAGGYNYYTISIDTSSPVPFAMSNYVAPNASPANGDTVTASIDLSGDEADKNATLILCIYKGITLIDMISDSITNGTAITDENNKLECSYTVAQSGTRTKAFVWDTFTGMIDISSEIEAD